MLIIGFGTRIATITLMLTLLKKYENQLKPNVPKCKFECKDNKVMSYLRFIQCSLSSWACLFILIILFQLLSFQFPGQKIQTHFLGEGDFWFATTQLLENRQALPTSSSVSLNNDPACHLVKVQNRQSKVVENQWHTQKAQKGPRNQEGSGVGAQRGTIQGIKGGPFVQFPTGEKSKTRVCWTTVEPAGSLKRVVNAVTVQQLPPSLVNSRHSSKHVVVKL